MTKQAKASCTLCHYVFEHNKFVVLQRFESSGSRCRSRYDQIEQEVPGLRDLDLAEVCQQSLWPLPGSSRPTPHRNPGGRMHLAQNMWAHVDMISWKSDIFCHGTGHVQETFEHFHRCTDTPVQLEATHHRFCCSFMLDVSHSSPLNGKKME